MIPMKISSIFNKRMADLIKENNIDISSTRLSPSYVDSFNHFSIRFFPDIDCYLFESEYDSYEAFYDYPVKNEWSNNRKWVFVKKSYRSALKKAIGIAYFTARTLSTMEESFTISLWDPQDTIPEIGITFYSNRNGFREVELENINEYNCPFMRIIITPIL